MAKKIAASRVLIMVFLVLAVMVRPTSQGFLGKIIRVIGPKATGFLKEAGKDTVKQVGKTVGKAGGCYVTCMAKDKTIDKCMKECGGTGDDGDHGEHGDHGDHGEQGDHGEHGDHGDRGDHGGKRMTLDTVKDTHTSSCEVGCANTLCSKLLTTKNSPADAKEVKKCVDGCSARCAKKN